MRQSDRIDLSALDPARDLQAFHRVADSLARKALMRRRSKSVSLQVVAWRVPALLLSAAVALVTWSLIAWSETEADAEVETTTLVSQWAARNELPAQTTQVFEAFQGHHERTQ